MDKKEVKAKKPAVVKAAAEKPSSAKVTEAKPVVHHVAAAHSPRLSASEAGSAPAHVPAAHGRYFEGIGRRKTASARVRVMKGSGKFKINDRTMEKYFQTKKLQSVSEEPLKRLNMSDVVDVSVKIDGGGINAQAEAVRHGISRALVLMNPDLKLQLASLGLLTRDSRMVERKKYGLKKARRAPQWKKR